MNHAPAPHGGGHHGPPNYSLPLFGIYRELRLARGASDPIEDICNDLGFLFPFAVIAGGSVAVGAATDSALDMSWSARVVWFLIDLGTVLAVGAYTHHRRWAVVDEERSHLQQAMLQEQLRRNRYEELTATVGTTADVTRLHELWEGSEVSIADQRRIDALFQAWCRANPPAFPSQVEARQVGRLCTCDPAKGHACANPTLGELGRLQALMAEREVRPVFRRSLRLLVLVGLLASASLVGANDSLGDCPGCSTQASEAPADTGNAADPGAQAPVPVQESSPEPGPSPMDGSLPASKRIAATTYRVDLTVNTDADQLTAGMHLLLRRVNVRESSDGTFMASGVVVNPNRVPVQAVIILNVLWHGDIVAGEFSDAGCVAAHGTRPITWPLGASDAGFVAYDDIRGEDSASVPGCGPVPAR